MTTISILRVAALIYAVAAGLFVYHFVRPRHARAAALGEGFLTGAFVVHAVSIGLGCAEFGGGEFFNLRGGFGMLGWLVAGALLLLLRAWRLPSVAAFVLPLILLALVPGVEGTIGGQVGAVPEVVRLPTLKLHVSAAIGGVALFAVAFAVALMYLLQEREVKGKHFGALFSRLPALDRLDKLNDRLVRLGLVIWSVALVTGMFVAKRSWGRAWSWDPQQVTSVTIWALYFGMVWMRHRGIHGRRYAVLTIAGFALVLGSMLGLGAVPSLTRHGGNFQ